MSSNQELIASLSNFHQNHLDPTVEQLLSNFDSAPNPPEILVYIQHWSTESLQRKLTESLIVSQQIWTNLLERCEIIHSFHCPVVYHELLFKLLSYLNSKNSDDSNDPESGINLAPFKSLASKFFLKQLNNHESHLWNTFQDSQDEPSPIGHCLCNSLKCLQLIIINQTEDPGISGSLDYHILDQLLNQILLKYSQQLKSSTRCLVYEFLKFCKFFINLKPREQYPRIHFLLKQWIESKFLLESFTQYFKNARDLCGNILQLDIDSLTPELSIEFRYDCPLIRCYVMLILKQENCSYQFLSNHLNLLKSKIVETQNSDDQEFPIEWIVQVFASEDTELFQMFHQILLLFGTEQERLNETDHLIHRLFRYFCLETIYNDCSVLLDMLCTEKSTATTFLRFLISYLKIPPFPRSTRMNTSNQIEWLKPIFAILQDLKNRIRKLDEKNLFPYNPKPLLRLLDAI